MATMAEKKFQYPLYQRVALTQSEERGVVIGRAEFTNRRDTYLVRYVTGDKRQVEAWIAEDALVSTI